jgi:hypothetical protein
LLSSCSVLVPLPLALSYTVFVTPKAVSHMVFTVHHVNIYIAQYGSSIRCYALKKNVYGVTVLVRQKHMYHYLLLLDYSLYALPTLAGTMIEEPKNVSNMF